MVEFGSYYIRCESCGEKLVATSFLTMRDTEHEVSAYLDRGHGKKPLSEALIARGSLREIAGAIGEVANGGTPVLLIWHGTET